MTEVWTAETWILCKLLRRHITRTSASAYFRTLILVALDGRGAWLLLCLGQISQAKGVKTDVIRASLCIADIIWYKIIQI